jgi:hypothetical protein
MKLLDLHIEEAGGLPGGDLRWSLRKVVVNPMLFTAVGCSVIHRYLHRAKSILRSSDKASVHSKC